MKSATIDFEIITPCFCAGADQAKAEIRPASIRGELRWWFRVLGGTPEQEKAVFGGVHGEVRASAVVVRVTDVNPRSDEKDLPNVRDINSPLSYLYYFASVSGKQKGQRGPGTRWRAGAFFSPGTTFRLHLLQRRSLPADLEALLQESIDAFLRLGALGSRLTRGCGAFVAEGHRLAKSDFSAWASALPTVTFYHLPLQNNWREAQKTLGAFLKEFRKKSRLSGKKLSALGCAAPRHGSCLRLRPVKVKEGFLPVVFYAERPLASGVQGVTAKLEAEFANKPK